MDRVPLIIHPGDHNADYLAAKRDKLGHLFQAGEASAEAGNSPRTVEDTLHQHNRGELGW